MNIRIINPNMKRIFMITAMLVTFMMAFAKKGDVKGKVIGTDGQPLGFVNVVLLSLPDSTFTEGMTTDSEGCFCIINTPKDAVLKVSCIGYETVYINISDFNGEVVMNEDAHILDEVTVKGQLPKTKLTGNSMVTTVEGTVLGKSGTAKEMLAKVPGMTQKGEDLEVLGKGTPIYYINGRKVNDKDELKRLRSEEIKEVEVITNPGAQYDATVSAVVRIKTIRRQGNGFGYDADISHQQNLRYGFADPGATLNLRYRHKNIDFFGLVNYWKWENATYAAPIQKSYFMDNGQIHVIEQESRFRNDWRGAGMNYNLGFNWQIADNHSVGARLERHDKFVLPMPFWQESAITQYIEGSTEKSTEMNYALQEERDHTPYNWEGNAYYIGKVGKLNIDINLDFLTNKTTESTTIEEHRDAIMSNYSTSNYTSNRMYAAKMVLSYPVWKGQLQAGSELTFVSRKNRYQMTGLALPNSDSHVNEDNIAAFAQYVCKIPKVGNLSAGLRYEHVGFDYTDILNAENCMARHTDDFFPSISWSNQWGSWQTSLNYSVKTSRPNYWQLSETMQYLNPYSLQQGDPKLKNATIYEVGANVRWNWLNLFMAYEQRNNTITQWSYIYNKEGVILIKQINLAEPIRNFAAFLSASPTWGCYSPNWTLGVQKFFNKLTLADPREASGERIVTYKAPIGFFDINNAFRFKHSWQLECNANIMTRGDVMNFRMLNTSFNLSFVVQKCWLKNDALCLRASISDIFQRSKQEIEMDCGYYTLTQRNRSNNHRLNLSLRYTFNATPSKYKGTGAGKEASERMGK